MHSLHYNSVPIIALFFCFFGCSTEGKGFTRFAGTDNSFQLAGEKVGVTPIVENEASRGLESPSVTTIAAAAVGLAIDHVEREVRKESSRHTQQYSAKAFVEMNSGDDLKKILFRRWVRYHDCADSAPLRMASEALFVLQQVSGQMYAVKLKEVGLRYSKAKVVWGKSDVDIEYTMAIEGFWTARGLLQKHGLLAGGVAHVKKLRLDPGDDHGICDLEEYERDKPFLDNKLTSGEITVGYVYLPEAAEVNDLVLGITIVATEQDSSRAGDLVLDVAELIGDNKSNVSGALVSQ